MRKRKIITILNILLQQYQGADSVVFNKETPDPADDIEMPGKDVCEAISAAISAVAAPKCSGFRRKSKKPAVLSIEIEVPEQCPYCMEHLSRDWAFCPECGRPTDWNPENQAKDDMAGKSIDPDNFSEADRAAVLRIAEMTNSPKNAHYAGIKDGDTFMIGDMEFIKFPDENGETPIVMRNYAFTSCFGKSNDLRTSDIMEKMHNNILPKIIAKIGKENLCTIKTDLTTLDGLNPYGTMESLISLFTYDFYRANISIFDRYKVDKVCWTATPESAPPHDNPTWVVCVAPSGFIDIDCYDYGGIGVRPLLRLKSSIFESLED